MKKIREIISVKGGGPGTVGKQKWEQRKGKKTEC